MGILQLNNRRNFFTIFELEITDRFIHQVFIMVFEYIGIQVSY